MSGEFFPSSHAQTQPASFSERLGFNGPSLIGGFFQAFGFHIPIPFWSRVKPKSDTSPQPPPSPPLVQSPPDSTDSSASSTFVLRRIPPTSALAGLAPALFPPSRRHSLATDTLKAEHIPLIKFSAFKDNQTSQTRSPNVESLGLEGVVGAACCKKHSEGGVAVTSSAIMVTPGTGSGHDFTPTQLPNPTWCDLCGDSIWSVYTVGNCVKCQNCNYTLHRRCRELVTLDCKTPTPEPREDDVLISDELDLTPTDPSNHLENVSELQRWINGYNSKCTDLKMTLLEDGETFHGFIRVHMNLSRPINVVAGTRPPSIYDIMYDEDENSDRTLTSFYLPRDTVKALHITSEMTSADVIRALLRKFKVVDNPHKYCLYEKCWDGERSIKAKLRLISDQERPLWLALRWATSESGPSNRLFALQENDTGDILWDAFTLPELGNFLKILDREEAEYTSQVKGKYQLMALHIRQALQYAKPANRPT